MTPTRGLSPNCSPVDRATRSSPMSAAPAPLPRKTPWEPVSPSPTPDTTAPAATTSQARRLRSSRRSAAVVSLVSRELACAVSMVAPRSAVVSRHRLRARPSTALACSFRSCRRPVGAPFTSRSRGRRGGRSREAPGTSFLPASVASEASATRVSRRTARARPRRRSACPSTRHRRRPGRRGQPCAPSAPSPSPRSCRRRRAGRP